MRVRAVTVGSAPSRPGAQQGQIPPSESGGVEESVRNRRCYAGNRRFARPGRGEVPAVERDDLNRRDVGEAGDAVLREARVQHLALGELDALVERPTQA